MTRNAKRHLAALALLLGSGGSTLVHRQIDAVVRPGPPHPAEFAIGLLTFALGSAGLILLIDASVRCATKRDI